MRIVISILLAVTVFACTQPKHDGYRINGDIKGLSEGKIVLAYFDQASRTQIPVDSANINNGKFELKGKVDYPKQLIAQLSPGNLTFNIWIENAQIKLVGEMKNATTDRWGRKNLPVQISGGAIQKEFDAYEALMKPIDDEARPFNEAYEKVNLEYMKGVRAKLPENEILILKNKAQAGYDALKPFTKRRMDVNKKYMSDHPNSFVTAQIISHSLSYMKPQDALAKYELFSDEIKNSVLGRDIKSKIDKSRLGAPGSKAAGFSKKDINGKSISLEDFKGQYVLLDFWASWCKPCRAGNPHLISLYNKYHEKGIEFIGIASDDNNIPAWNKAVKKDKIGIWRHILSGTKESGNNIGDMYVVKTLPTKVLIDPNGKIIGRFSADGETDEEMDQKFKEIFGF